MATNFAGAGVFALRQAESGLLLPMQLADFTIVSEVENEEEVKGFPLGATGKLQTTDVKEGETSWTLTTTNQTVDTQQLDLSWAEKPESQNLALPKSGVWAIPNPNARIAVTGLAADTPMDCSLLQNTGSGNSSLQRVASGSTLTSGQFKVEDGGVDFFDDLAGKSVFFLYMGAAETKDIRGAAAVGSGLGEFEFVGRYEYSRTEIRQIWIPSIVRKGGANIAPTADDVAVEWTMKVPSNLAWTHPFAEYAL